MATSFFSERASRLEDWKGYISEFDEDRYKDKSLIQYAKNLEQQGLPVIWSRKHLSYSLGIDPDIVFSISEDSGRYYREFEIPKRKGGSRLIQTPLPLLKELQKWILHELLDKVVLHEAAKGFVKGRSVLDHAKEHAGQLELLVVDIKDFFPSIHQNRINAIFVNMGYQYQLAHALSKICCLAGCLPQGAPTSPALSNIICKRLDRRLTGLSKKYNLTYTRYADDMAFSGEYIPIKYIEYVRSILQGEQLSLNDDKTRLLKGTNKKIITGISIGSGVCKLPKSARRELRQAAHKIITRGVLGYVADFPIDTPFFMDRLIGRFGFWKFIEPNNQYVLSTLDKLESIRNEFDSFDASMTISPLGGNLG